jgi:hypothetical protein
MALARDLNKYPLDMIAWSIEWETIRDLSQNKPLKWQVGKQIVPFNCELKSLFESKSYKQMVKEKMKELMFEIDIEKYNQIKEKRRSK